MKCLFVLFYISLFIVGCGVPLQNVNLDKNLIGLNPNEKDIALTNMPGHELPEIPMECVCPNWYGLDHNPCCKPKIIETKPEPKLIFTTFSDDLLYQAEKNNKLIIVIYYDEYNDWDRAAIGSLGFDKCFIKETWEHYYVVKTTDKELYYHLINDHSKNLLWQKKNHISTPAVLIIHDGYTLPITFESTSWYARGGSKNCVDFSYQTPDDCYILRTSEESQICRMVKGMWGATR